MGDLAAEPHRKASDLTELRRLADDGNEEAEARLAELAVQHGDVERVRRLADDGNEKAARRLTELAVDRGDVEELRRRPSGKTMDAVSVLRYRERRASLDL